MWKELGNRFYGRYKDREALLIYDHALTCCPSDERELKRDLSSNVSLVNFRLQNYNKAKTSAEACIKIDPNWYKVELYIFF